MLFRSGADLAGVVSFHGGLDFPSSDDARHIKAKLLVLTGADDPSVPLAKVDAFADQLRSAGVDYQIVLYGGAQHAFTNPEADRRKMPGAAYNASADRRSWQAMRDFFAEIFP